MLHKQLKKVLQTNPLYNRIWNDCYGDEQRYYRIMNMGIINNIRMRVSSFLWQKKQL